MELLQLLIQLILWFLLVDSENNFFINLIIFRMVRIFEHTFEQRSILVMTIMIVSFNAWAVAGQF